MTVAPPPDIAPVALLLPPGLFHLPGECIVYFGTIAVETGVDSLLVSPLGRIQINCSSSQKISFGLEQALDYPSLFLPSRSPGTVSSADFLVL